MKYLDLDDVAATSQLATQELTELRAELEALREELRIQKRMALRMEACIHNLVKETEES